MRFGVFLAPFNPVGQNPTLALERDLELIQHMDRLGYDEAWIGEHHSAGVEIIASPEVFIAAAAERTRHIRLGTGVSSVPYHHPYLLADRMVLLDHLTRGRAMFGVGPGQLTSDAWMLGIDPNNQRRMLEEGLEAVLALFEGDKPVTRTTDWFTMRDATLQLRPYTYPHMEMAVAASISPTGPKLAGKHGLGLLSIAAWNPSGFEVLGGHWDVVVEQAAAAGRPAPDRSGWRMMGPVHVAETDAQARRDIEHGFLPIFDYLGHIIPLPESHATTLDEVVDEINANGTGAIGTPDRAIEFIERLQAQSGGFGSFLMLGGELANREAMFRSYELFAQYVMPHFQGQLTGPQRSFDWVMGATEGSSTTWVNATTTAIKRATEQYKQDRPGRHDLPAS
jgi:limonene 1,2-monooxygenase